MTDCELGWVAGILDGEGCISVQKGRQRKPYEHLHTYNLKVSVSSTSMLMLEKLRALVGGRFHPQNAKNGKWSPAWQWQVYNMEAVALLDSVRHLLVVKRSEAKVALEWTMRVLGESLEDRVAKREDIRQRLQVLKKAV